MTSAPSPASVQEAPALTVARVCIDSPLPHLDRAFDYSVPEKLAGRIAVGSRVRVRFAGRLVSAVVTDLTDSSDFDGALSPVHHCSEIPSYTPEAISLARAVAERCAGSLWDVLRLMAPPRVAAVEKRADSLVGAMDGAYESALARASERWGAARMPGAVGRRVVQSAPAISGVDAPALLAGVVQAAARGESGIVVVPDARALGVVASELEAIGLTRWSPRGGQVAVVSHDDGPQRRFGAYVAAMRGLARIVVGLRPTVMQPVPSLGAIALWDDGSGVYEEPHAPYAHARTVAAMRAGEGVDACLAGWTPSVDAFALVRHGWASLVEPSRAAVREAAPAVDVLTSERRESAGGAGRHWMPPEAWRAVTRGLEVGPVAVVVPRAGFANAVLCARCRERALCEVCEAPLGQPTARALPTCIACGREHRDWHCPHCHGSAVARAGLGVEAIAEQIAAMTREPVAASSAASGVLADGSVDTGIVVATPGAVPAVDGGYAAAVVVDAAAIASGELGAELEAMRRWLAVGALVRGRARGGRLVLIGDMPERVRMALTTWSPIRAVEEEYDERASLSLPPVTRAATVLADDPRQARSAARAAVDEMPGAVLAEIDGGALILASRGAMGAIASRLRASAVAASAEGAGALRVRIDAPLGRLLGL